MTDTTAMLVYLVPLALVLFFYLRRHRRKEQRHVSQLEEAVQSGLTEPASLHPVFDPNRCIGSGACVSTAAMVAWGVGPAKGGRPASISYPTIPSAKMSAR